MPLPLAPIAAFALRAGVVAAAAWAARRALQPKLHPGRIDQRAEDALDDLDEGLTVHRPKDRDQTNATLRSVRTIRWGSGGVEIDAAAFGRLRIRRL